MNRKIINIAYSIYPDYKSSEGIVNYNWLKILRNNSNQIVEISQKRIINYSESTNEVFQLENSCYSALKKESLMTYLVYKILNFIYCRFTGNTSLYEYLWVQKTSRLLEKEYTKGDVVWSRILPTNSLISIFKFYNKREFPFIVNVNDPIVPNISTNKKLNRCEVSVEEKLLIGTKNIAQAWTFPSSQLADNIAKKYNLDRNRCFVIPHAYTPFKKLYHRKNSTIKILYTGTFYKSAFTDEFKDTLESLKKLEIYTQIEFTFVLSQYNQESIDWLNDTLPNVVLKFKLDRSEVLDLLKESDLMLVIDAETHTDLLKGKLIEAISYGVPVYTPTYKGSVMDKVTTEYGCNSAYQDVKGDSLIKLLDMIKKIENEEWLEVFYKKREKVIEKISEETILKMTYDIVEFAYQRFFKNENYTIKKHYNWP